MQPKPIGIIGGAGPLAGAFLLEKVISLSSKLYGCYRDADYPKIFLISFPFSEMLSASIDMNILKQELSQCLDHLRNNGSAVLAIACNTLHAFLDEKDLLDDLVHLPKELSKEIPLNKKPLVLCTSTSAKKKVHEQFFPCTYPDIETQNNIDDLIDKILFGIDKKSLLKQLNKLLEEQNEDTIVLGCTELSLFSGHLSLQDKKIIDPLDVVANKILQKSFKL